MADKASASPSAHFETLTRILKLEQSRNAVDDAVIGGLERFLVRWVDRSPADARPIADAIAALLDGYHAKDIATRQELIAEALRLAPMSNGPTPTTSPTAGRDDREGGQRASPRAGKDPVSGIATRPAAARDETRTAIVEPSGPPRRRAAARSSAIAATAPAAGGLAASVQTLRGVGDAQAGRLKRLGVETIHDLLYHFPRRYIDYRDSKLIRDLAFSGLETILGTVWKVTAENRPGGLIIIRATVGDESGTAEAVWLRRKDFLSQELTTGRTIMLSGECQIIGGRPVFRDPDWEHFVGLPTIHTARLVPVYPLVEGLNGRSMRRLLRTVTEQYAPSLADHLPAEVRAEHRLLDLPMAIAEIHFPDSDELTRAAQRRLAFDELFIIQIGVIIRKRQWKEGDPALPLTMGDAALASFLDHLPFRLTVAQQRALGEIRADLARSEPMGRLLQGDVGSGKTAVAAAAMVLAVSNGQQAALMAPTEILAEQHARTLAKLFDSLGDKAPRVRLLTGSQKRRSKRDTTDALAAGAVDVAVGTQALIQEGVSFDRLGLVIVDEQHRFGVIQRSALRQKGYNPHMLVMTATPIPRTLALTVFGDMDLSLLDELPPGRLSIATRVVDATERPRAYAFLRREAHAGHQAFIICPLVEESEHSEARAATSEYERLQRDVFPDLRMGLLHGRMKPAEKEAAMKAFQQGVTDVLVSTSVVEVGIDVPNATVMLIEGANRFGLAQLHQFRGRVGRGSSRSYCFLIADSSNDGSVERLEAVEKSRDGFALAEEDLRLRGPGEFFGTRQSGLPDLKMARMTDTALLVEARGAAERLLARDPALRAPEHQALRASVDQFWHGDVDLS